MADEPETDLTEDQKQEQADMLAAFAGEALPEKTAAESGDGATEAKPEASEEPPAEPEAAKPEEPKPEYVQFTREEAEALRRSAAIVASLQQDVRSARSVADRAHGIAGDVQKQWKEGSGTAEFSEADFPGLAEYPDVLKAIVAGLNARRRTAPAAAPTVDPSSVRDHVRAQYRAVELENLTEVYPDWETITANTKERQAADPGNEYRAWVARQPENYREAINKTSSPEFLKRSIDRFMADKERPVRAAPQQPAAPARAATPAAAPPPQRQFRTAVRPSRLRAAVMPNGDARAAAPAEGDEHSDMMKAFYGT